MAKLLDIKTVAEFVSSEEIFEEVVKLDIDYAQGFYIDKPKFIEEILEEEKIPEIY
jgi:EAL domain-containing protein (putative c-di-GMP-specific phosphodiesterase class I)